MKPRRQIELKRPRTGTKPGPWTPQPLQLFLAVRADSSQRRALATPPGAPKPRVTTAPTRVPSDCQRKITRRDRTDIRMMNCLPLLVGFFFMLCSSVVSVCVHVVETHKNNSRLDSPLSIIRDRGDLGPNWVAAFKRKK